MTALSPIGQHIQHALATSLRRDSATIRPEDHLRDDLGLDSLTVFELLYELEKRFDLAIPNEDLPDLQTFGDVAAYVEARVASSPPSTNAASISPAPRRRSVPAKTGPRGARAGTKSGVPRKPSPPGTTSSTASTPTTRTAGKSTPRKVAAKSKKGKR